MDPKDMERLVPLPGHAFRVIPKGQRVAETTTRVERIPIKNPPKPVVTPQLSPEQEAQTLIMHWVKHVGGIAPNVAGVMPRLIRENTYSDVMQAIDETAAAKLRARVGESLIRKNSDFFFRVLRRIKRDKREEVTEEVAKEKILAGLEGKLPRRRDE